jgi:hypothetical protein
MTSIRRLASVLCLALYFSNYSNAQVNVIEGTHSISDDGYVNVPLQFDFPYYGETFNNSWMFSNGIISFVNPQQSGLSWWNLSVQQFSAQMGSQFDYSIYPLWTDLINLSGTFSTQGSDQFQRYNWIGISPYYSPNRLNTFSVEIRPDGQIITNYSLIDVNYASIGMVGNSSKGEFEQIYNSWSQVTTNSVSSWERNTYAPIAEEPYLPELPQYQQIIVTPTVEIVETEIGVEATPITTQQSNTQPTSQNEISSATSTNETQQQQQSLGSGISLSTVLNIVAREQARIARLESSIVESSIEQSARQAQQATEQTEALVIANVNESISISILSAQSQMLLDQQQIKASSQSSGGGLNFLSENFSSPLSLDSSLTQSEQSIQIEEPRSSKQEQVNLEVDVMKSETASVAGFSAVEIIKDNETIDQNQTQTQTQSDTVKQNVPNNELAGNVTLASLGSPPEGFNLYSTAMPDVSFYASREIYRNQRVIDNPASRRLFNSTDRLHQEMVDQQYIGR